MKKEDRIGLIIGYVGIIVLTFATISGTNWVKIPDDNIFLLLVPLIFGILILLNCNLKTKQKIVAILSFLAIISLQGFILWIK